MPKNALSMVQNARLVNYIEKNYKLLNLTDSKFAVKASEELGLTITDTHIRGRREELGIEANYEFGGSRRNKNDASNEFQEYVAALERRVTALEFELAELKNKPVK